MTGSIGRRIGKLLYGLVGGLMKSQEEKRLGCYSDINNGACYLLGFTAAIAVVSLFVMLNSFPRLILFDFAAEATFINNIAHRANIYYGLETTSHQNKEFILSLAATRYVYAYLLSLVVKVFSISPLSMDYFIKIAGASMCLFAFLVPSWLMTANSRNRLFDMLVLCGLSLVLPSVFIFGRSGAAFNLMIALLYWLVVACVWQYAKTQKVKCLYFAAILCALLVINLYQLVLTLPIVAIGILVVFCRFKDALCNKHTYLAAALFFLLTTFLVFCVGAATDGSAQVYLDRIMYFLNMRAVRFEGYGIRPVIVEKVIRFYHQVVTFEADAMGDRSIPSDIWLPASVSWSYLLWLIMACFGIVMGLRTKDELTKLFTLISSVIILFALTISIPEGRYLLGLWPCIVYFGWYGLKIVIKHEPARCVVLSVIIIAMATESWGLLINNVNPYVNSLWPQSRHMKAYVKQLPPAEEGVREYIALPGPKKDYAWYYFAMFSNSRGKLVSIEQLKNIYERDSIVSDTIGNQKRSRFYIYSDEKYRKHNTWLKAKGFSEVSNVVLGKGTTYERKILLFERSLPL